MASFQTKIGWKRPRKRENKSSRSVSFLPNASYKISKKQPKNSKYKKKIPIWQHFKPKQVGKGCGSDKIKISVPSWKEIEN